MTTTTDRTTDSIAPIDPKTQSWTVMVPINIDKRLGIGFHEDGLVISFYNASSGDKHISMDRVTMSYEAFESLVNPSPSQQATTN